MRFINKGEGPKGGKYLRCSASVRGMDCVSTTWRYEDFEKSVFTFVREFDLRSIVENNRHRSEVTATREERSILHEKLESLLAERERVYRLLVDRHSETEKFLTEQLDILSQSVAKTQSEIDGLDEKLAEFPFQRMAKSDIDEQLAALSHLTEHADFHSRLLVSTKLQGLIKRIDVSPDGSRPRIDVLRIIAEEQIDNLEYRAKLIAALENNNLTGPRSNPYFSVIFHDGSSRTVVPNREDPASLNWQVDHDESGARLTGASGQTDLLFPTSLD